MSHSPLHGRYRYLAVQLGAPFGVIAELPLAQVVYERLRNGTGNFSAQLRMPALSKNRKNVTRLVEVQTPVDTLHVTGDFESDQRVDIMGSLPGTFEAGSAGTWLSVDGTLAVDSTEPAHGGSRSLRGTKTGSAGTFHFISSGFGAAMSVTPGQSIVVEAWTKHKNGVSSGTGMWMQWALGGVFVSNYFGPVVSAPTNTWTKITQVVVVPAGVNGLRLSPYVQGVPSGNQVWIDDVTVTRQNPVDTWVTETPANMALNQEDDFYHDGVLSLRATRVLTTGTLSVFSGSSTDPKIPAVEDQEVTTGMWVRHDSAAPIDIVLRHRHYAGTSSLGDDAADAVTVHPGIWTHLQHTSIAPATSTGLQINVTTTPATVVANISLWIDEVEATTPEVSHDTITESVAVDNEEAILLARTYKEATDHGATCIYVLRDGVPMGGWIVWTQTYDPTTQVISINGAELPSYFAKRIVEGGTTLDHPRSFVNVPSIALARLLLVAANDIGLQFDVTNEGALLTREWRGTDDKKVSDAVREIADGVGGFDWRCDVRRTQDGFARVWVARPQLVGVVGGVAHLNATVTNGRITRNGAERTNDAVALGRSETDVRPWGRKTTNLFLPKLTSVLSLMDEESQVALQGHAEAEVTINEVSELRELEVVASDSLDVGSFNPGDRVRVITPRGVDPWEPDGTDELIRTVGFRVTVPDAQGPEQMTLLVDTDA